MTDEIDLDAARRMARNAQIARAIRQARELNLENGPKYEIDLEQWRRPDISNGSKYTKGRTLEAAEADMVKPNGTKNGNGRARWIGLVCTLIGIIFGAGVAYGALYYKVDGLCVVVADHETRIREDHDLIIKAAGQLESIEKKLDKALEE